MLVKRGVRVGTEFGEGEVVAVTREWVIVDCGGTTREVSLHREDSPVWCVPTLHEVSGGDESFVGTEDADHDDISRRFSENYQPVTDRPCD